MFQCFLFSSFLFIPLSSNSSFHFFDFRSLFLWLSLLVYFYISVRMLFSFQLCIILFPLCLMNLGWSLFVCLSVCASTSSSLFSAFPLFQGTFGALQISPNVILFWSFSPEKRPRFQFVYLFIYFIRLRIPGKCTALRKPIQLRRLFGSAGNCNYYPYQKSGKNGFLGYNIFFILAVFLLALFRTSNIFTEV